MCPNGYTRKVRCCFGSDRIFVMYWGDVECLAVVDAENYGVCVGGRNQHPEPGGRQCPGSDRSPYRRRKLGRTPAEYPVSPFGHLIVAARGFSRGRGH